MHIRDIFAAHPTTFSFEFFPQERRGPEDLFAAIVCLQVEPSFVSVLHESRWFDPRTHLTTFVFAFRKKLNSLLSRI